MFKSKWGKKLLVVIALCAVAYAVQTPLTPQVAKENNYAVQAGDLALTETACDAVNGNSFPLTGHEILIVHNTDAAAAHTFTVTSIPDQLGRSGDITAYSVPLSSIAAIYMNTISGWQQTNGTVLLACNSNLLKYGILRLAH